MAIPAACCCWRHGWRVLLVVLSFSVLAASSSPSCLLTDSVLGLTEIAYHAEPRSATCCAGLAGTTRPSARVLAPAGPSLNLWA